MTVWPLKKIRTPGGVREAIAPLIVSASRRTDIPAFYSDWFMQSWRAGYTVWRNPFSGQSHYLSLWAARTVVFWSKNPRPLLKYLGELERRNLAYYFQFTLNDYDHEGLEPNLPPLEKRIETFKTLSSLTGRERVIWRFDPLILTDTIGVDLLLEKIRRLGEEIHRYTEKLVISFADISRYRKVRRNLAAAGVHSREFGEDEMKEVARGLKALNEKWRLKIATCAEGIDLSAYGISHNKCIDDELIARIAGKEEELRAFLGYDQAERSERPAGRDRRRSLKDRGQRPECRCVVSKDIGRYNTCGHGCLYCYAGSSPKPRAVRLPKAGITDRQCFQIIT
jgi:DNA repair photolyase